MKKSWGLIPKILSSEKTIESRWYKHKVKPWNAIVAGDRIYFKNSGEPVTATARVSRVQQFELTSMEDVKEIVRKYGKKICLAESDPTTWGALPRYVILIHVSDPKSVKPFSISKKGYGSAAAWMVMRNIKDVKL